MQNRRGFTLVEMLTVITIIGILAAILFPVMSSAKKKAQGTTCQNNISQLAKAIKQYVADNNDSLPTNNIGGVFTPEMKLAHGTNTTPANEANWVEALYKYTEPVGSPADITAWTCPLASPGALIDPATDATTYVINANALDRPDSSIKTPATTMLFREMDRRCGAICRPRNVSTSNQIRPEYAFLTTIDTPGTGTITCNPKIHGPGSNIVFADGHVKTMPTGDMPTDDQLQWDANTRQWWNPQRTIAVTP